MEINELVKTIQDGAQSLLPELWERVQKFVFKRARIYQGNFANRPDIERADLINSGYIAMCKAVETYKEDGGLSFVGWLLLYLRKEWRELYGINTSRVDALDHCVSFSEPIGGEKDDITLESTLEDTDAQQTLEAAEKRADREWLSNSIREYINTLPDDGAETIQALYFDGKTEQQYASEVGTSPGDISRLKHKSLNQLRSKARYTPLGQQIKAYYYDRLPEIRRVSVAEFQTTHSSEVEKYVLEADRLERLAWRYMPLDGLVPEEITFMSACRIRAPEAVGLLEKIR